MKRGQNRTVRMLGVVLLIAGLGYCAYSGVFTGVMDSEIPDATADG